MVKNYRKQYSREDAMKSLEFLQSAVDGIRHVMIGILNERMEATQNLEPEEDDEFPPVVMAINPTGFVDVFSCGEFRKMMEEDDTFAAQDLVFEEQVFLRYNEEDVVELGGNRYLLGTAVVFELDQDGNEVSVTHDTIENVFDYVEANLTCIEVDELTIPAFRLNV